MAFRTERNIRNAFAQAGYCEKKIQYKRAARKYMRLSKKADSDYKAGFFYGKAKLFEQKLKETRYFDYD